MLHLDGTYTEITVCNEISLVSPPKSMYHKNKLVLLEKRQTWLSEQGVKWDNESLLCV